MCSSRVGERTLAREAGSMTKAVMVMMVKKKEEGMAIESEAEGTIMRQSSVVAKRNMPARWGKGLLGCVKIDFPPLLQLARVLPHPLFFARRTMLTTFPCRLCLGGSIWCLSLWVLVNDGMGTCFVLSSSGFFCNSPCRVGLSDNVSQFLDVPSGTRDLTKHLEDLACRYPVEAVERTSLKFCEALSQWRGKPELEKVSPHLHSAFCPLLSLPPIQNELPILPRFSHPVPPLPFFSLFPSRMPLDLVPRVPVDFSLPFF